VHQRPADRGARCMPSRQLPRQLFQNPRDRPASARALARGRYSPARQPLHVDRSMDVCRGCCATGQQERVMENTCRHCRAAVVHMLASTPTISPVVGGRARNHFQSCGLAATLDGPPPHNRIASVAMKVQWPQAGTSQSRGPVVFDTPDSECRRRAPARSDTSRRCAGDEYRDLALG